MNFQKILHIRELQVTSERECPFVVTRTKYEFWCLKVPNHVEKLPLNERVII